MMSCLKKMGKFKPARKTIVYVCYKSDLIFQMGHSQQFTSEAICQENFKATDKPQTEIREALDQLTNAEGKLDTVDQAIQTEPKVLETYSPTQAGYSSSKFPFHPEQELALKRKENLTG